MSRGQRTEFRIQKSEIRSALCLLISVFCLLPSVLLAPIVVIVNPYRGTFGGGVSYFFFERFETTGFQQAWTKSGTTVNEDYATSPAPLEGAQSLLINAAGSTPEATGPNFVTDETELWLFFKVNFISFPSAEKRFVHLLDTAAAVALDIAVSSTGTIRVYNGTGASTATVTAMATNTIYNCWAHFKTGSGANGQASVGFSTTGTEVVSGNQFSSTTAGTGTVAVRKIKVGLTGTSTYAFIIDQILISKTGTIGDNPL